MVAMSIVLKRYLSSVTNMYKFCSNTMAHLANFSNMHMMSHVETHQILSDDMQFELDFVSVVL